MIGYVPLPRRCTGGCGIGDTTVLIETDCGDRLCRRCFDETTRVTGRLPAAPKTDRAIFHGRSRGESGRCRSLMSPVSSEPRMLKPAGPIGCGPLVSPREWSRCSGTGENRQGVRGRADITALDLLPAPRGQYRRRCPGASRRDPARSRGRSARNDSAAVGRRRSRTAAVFALLDGNRRTMAAARTASSRSRRRSPTQRRAATPGDRPDFGLHRGLGFPQGHRDAECARDRCLGWQSGIPSAAVLR